MLDRIADAPEVVRGGISAAPDHGVDLLASDGFEGYVRASDLDALVSRFALDGEAERPNAVLRVADDAEWPFRQAQVAADRAVVAVDLLEFDDPRSQRSGAELAGRL